MAVPIPEAEGWRKAINLVRRYIEVFQLNVTDFGKEVHIGKRVHLISV